MQNKSPLVWLIVVGIVVVGLFVWSNVNDPNKDLKKQWADADIKCVANNAQLLQHIHPHLTIVVDGVEELIPSNTGIVQGCIAEIHTHDEAGVIHVESPRPNKTFTLGQFFVVFGKPIVREGYNVIVGADGVTTPEFSGYLEAEQFYKSIELKDKQEIKIEYTIKK